MQNLLGELEEGRVESRLHREQRVPASRRRAELAQRSCGPFIPPGLPFTEFLPVCLLSKTDSSALAGLANIRAFADPGTAPVMKAWPGF